MKEETYECVRCGAEEVFTWSLASEAGWEYLSEYGDICPHCSHELG